jgi:hypothetical protein
VAWADYDNDGFRDLYVIKGGETGYLSGPHKLYRNQGNANHWLELNLVGTESNRQGIGAKVQLSSGGVTQVRQKNGGTHYLCQNSSILHFGLGTATQADTITITWPSGLEQVLNEVEADQILSVEEGIDPEPTATPTITPTITATVTVTITETPTVTPTATVTETPTVTMTATVTGTPTVTTTATVTETPTVTVTATVTGAPTITATPTYNSTTTPSQKIYLPLIIKKRGS